jgi:integrase
LNNFPPDKEKPVNEEEIKAVLDNMDRTTVFEAFALLLAESGERPPEKAIPRFANFAQALLYLKNTCDFVELSLFSIEAGLVYIEIAGRRILLTDCSVSGRTAGRSLPAVFGSGKGGGCFSRLELEEK